MDSRSPKPDPVVAEVIKALEAMGLVMAGQMERRDGTLLRVIVPRIR